MQVLQKNQIIRPLGKSLFILEIFTVLNYIHTYFKIVHLRQFKYIHYQKLPVPFIINEQKCIFRQIFERYLNQKSIMLDYTIELWSIHTIKSLVKNNVGVSFLPTFAVQKELKDGELVEIKTDISDIQISAVCG